MKFIVLFAAIALMSAGVALADEPAKTMTLPSAKQGNVTFEHEKHMKMKDSCAPCHATSAGGKIEGFGKDMAHQVCKGCHTDQKAGPTGCKDCHHK